MENGIIMKNKNQKIKGKDGFDSFYKEIYKERWDNLKECLLTESNPVEFFVQGAEKPYYLDNASIIAASMLPLSDASDIIDLCAAPGGKSIVIASRMNEAARLVSNERSKERVKRLRNSIKDCLPESIQNKISVWCSDGALLCKTKAESFDAILLDAPCSSERHVIKDAKYLNEWSPSRIKTVTSEQWALLSSAYRSLKKGGYLLYSTCAIAPQENDEMIQKLIKKFNKETAAFEIIEPFFDKDFLSPYTSIDISEIEKTQYGYHIMPDKNAGSGPIYFSLIHKLDS